MKNLREIRKKNNLSMKKLAELIGMAESTLSLYESGKREPDNQTLLKLSEVLNCSIDYLLGNSDEPKTLDEQLDGISFALNSETKELTDEQKQDVLNFVRFIKSQNKENI